MAVNELVRWDFLPEDVKPAVYPGRTDVPAEQLTWNRVFRVHVGVPPVEADHDIQRRAAARVVKLHRLSVNDQVQPLPIASAPIEIDGHQPELPGAKYTLTPTTLRPEWPKLEK
jgi:hypothetical protein